jgi:hypothetical protein
MLKEFTWGPGRETHVLLRRPRFLGHPSTTFIEHTFLPFLSCVSLMSEGGFSEIGVLEKSQIIEFFFFEFSASTRQEIH